MIRESSKWYGSYQDYVDSSLIRETIETEKRTTVTRFVGFLKTELVLSDKLSGRLKEYLVDLNSEDVDPDEI